MTHHDRGGFTAFRADRLEMETSQDMKMLAKQGEAVANATGNRSHLNWKCSSALAFATCLVVGILFASVAWAQGGTQNSTGNSAFEAIFTDNTTITHAAENLTKWHAVIQQSYQWNVLDIVCKRIARSLCGSDVRNPEVNSVYAMAQKVNRSLNRIQYVSDDANWGRSDYWSGPREFLEAGGDCEDFAIAKYFTLRYMGVPSDQMRIVVSRDTEKNVMHAFLIVSTESGLMVLDNRDDDIIPARFKHNHVPMFSLNEHGVRFHSRA